MTPVPDGNTFESAYAGQVSWDSGRPQKAFLDVADQVTGAILLHSLPVAAASAP